MKKHFLLIVSLLASVCAFAQNGVTTPYRFGQGEDSVKCIQAISLYSVNLKNKNYDVAYENWKTVYNNYPVARVDTYTNGEKLLKALIAASTDEAKKAGYVKQYESILEELKRLGADVDSIKAENSDALIHFKVALDAIKTKSEQ